MFRSISVFLVTALTASFASQDAEENDPSVRDNWSASEDEKNELCVFMP